MFRHAIVLLLINSVLSYTVDSKPQYDLEQVDSYFEDFVSSYNKSYPSEEEKAKRLAIFRESVQKINELNRSSKTAVFAVTQFADLTKEEFIATYTGVRPGDLGADSCVPYNMENMLSAPEELDWRTRNVVTPVKDQKQCGSCWAFSATGSVESQYAMKYQTQVDLSEQQLVDCDKGSSGCQGGWPYSALSTLVSEGGHMFETDYPYAGSDGTCSFDVSKVQVKLSGCNKQRLSSEDAVKKVIANVGPLSFVLDADSLQYYNGGILDNCDGSSLNHAVLLVGYGTENGVPYWIVKNSWGTVFGEQGFFKIRRGVNACGMMGYGFYSSIIA